MCRSQHYAFKMTSASPVVFMLSLIWISPSQRRQNKRTTFYLNVIIIYTVSSCNQFILLMKRQLLISQLQELINMIKLYQSFHSTYCMLKGCPWLLLVSADCVSGDHLLHSVCSGYRSFPCCHLVIPAKGSAGGTLPHSVAQVAAGVARLSAAVQPWNLPLAAQPVRVPLHWPACRLLHYHPLLSSDPLPAWLPPLSAAQISPGEKIHTGCTEQQEDVNELNQ